MKGILKQEMGSAAFEALVGGLAGIIRHYITQFAGIFVTQGFVERTGPQGGSPPETNFA